MNDEIKRSDEMSHDEIMKFLHSTSQYFKKQQTANLDFQKEMIDRMARVETRIEHLTQTIEKFISKNDVQLDDINKRIDLMERKLDEAEGAIKMLRWLSGALAGIITGLIGILMKYVR